MTGSAIINALAFTGGNMLGSMVFGRKAEEERRKRDVAMRQQQEEHEKWERERQARIDFISNRVRERNEARGYISDLNEGMRLYYELTKPQHQLPNLRKEPVLSDFYHPAEWQKTGEILFMAISGALLGYVVVKKMM